MFKTPEHFKDISYLPKTPRFTLASKTTAILIIERKKSSKVSSKVSPVNTNTHFGEIFHQSYQPVRTTAEQDKLYLVT